MSKNPTKAKKHLTVLLMLILIIAVFLLGVSGSVKNFVLLSCNLSMFTADGI